VSPQPLGERVFVHAGLRQLDHPLAGVLGFESLARGIDAPAKSLHRMLSASGNPTMTHLSAIFAAIKRRLRVEVRTRVVAA
jgi:DNA-binding phage protein